MVNIIWMRKRGSSWSSIQPVRIHMGSLSQTIILYWPLNTKVLIIDKMGKHAKIRSPRPQPPQRIGHNISSNTIIQFIPVGRQFYREKNVFLHDFYFLVCVFFLLPFFFVLSRRVSVVYLFIVRLDRQSWPHDHIMWERKRKCCVRLFVLVTKKKPTPFLCCVSKVKVFVVLEFRPDLSDLLGRKSLVCGGSEWTLSRRSEREDRIPNCMPIPSTLPLRYKQYINRNLLNLYCYNIIHALRTNNVLREFNHH